ncbi:MAG: flagellar biosynthesis anti-sigma factor FlgM [Oligoflexia bacterium]|nr:flagellar biosynthesis anti-sigma factor FlgM [Oligoflexia bacterium]
MKVTDKTSIDQLDGTAKAQGSKRKGAASSAQQTGNVSSSDQLASAKVKLSERAQDMKKVKDVVNSVPDVDEAKVAKFKAMIAKGEYKPDSAKTADKMVDEHAYNDFLTKTDG